jgi:pSer/pThr/pTyr-binding forkhead associated (FHA) protein
MPWLSLNGLPFELSRRETIVGSGAQATWKIPSIDLRPRHFVIEAGDGRASVRPFSTHDVVTLNGRQIASDAVPLTDGDVIAAGNGFFAYSAGRPEPREDLSPLIPPVAYLVDDVGARAYALQHASTGIGRDPSNLVVLDDADASRFHAEVRREAGGFAVHSTGSAGTRLNGHALSSPRLLEPGDEINIAGRAIRFEPGPLSPALSANLQSGMVHARASRRPAALEAAASDKRMRAVFGVIALLVLIAVVVAVLSR